jgi:catechol 2,3-dioxygenase-like lactoylglutathione lyase family enzyme
MDIRICVDVHDMARAIAFYTDGLGLRCGRRFQSGFVELLGGSSPIDLLLNPEGSPPLPGEAARCTWTLSSMTSMPPSPGC